VALGKLEGAAAVRGFERERGPRLGPTAPTGFR